MRAFSVSVRMRRLPVKRMRSMTVPGGWAGGSWNEGGSELLVTFSVSSESNEEESEDGNSAPLEWLCGAAGAEASNNTIAATQNPRTRKIPNGKETLVYAASEVLTAAPPNPRCSSPAGPGMGRPCVYPVDPGATHVGVRFPSGRPGLPHPRDGTKDLPLRRKFAASRPFGFHPG